MAYTALARTWRPKKFAELVGQEHVRRALTNALETGRVHHAFLFTGTRGVGKTTIARIFAKCLNCEIGVTANPCGICGACREIDSGRFVDLVEVDAASNTKVDDTRELLDNVQYAPARGRYKVYLIDEVHMLSTHSFNALLKTLEEPPPHVKFLLATTDPQKLPVTVLSRCLQFNLKRLPVALIADRMKEILEKEGIPFEPAGLRLVAQAADGSMRDGLSLLDQLIAFGNGRAGEEEARAMLGTIARDHVVRLAELLGAMNVPELLSCARSLEEFAPDYAQVLDELSSLFVRIAMKQALSDFEGDELYDLEVLTRLAKAIAPEDVQLFYQTAITGRRDLGLAPDPRSGFEMTLLRMIAFRPLGEAEQTRGGPSAGGGGGGSAASSSSGGGAAAARAAAARPQRAPEVRALQTLARVHARRLRPGVQAVRSWRQRGIVRRWQAGAGAVGSSGAGAGAGAAGLSGALLLPAPPPASPAKRHPRSEHLDQLQRSPNPATETLPSAVEFPQAQSPQLVRLCRPKRPCPRPLRLQTQPPTLANPGPPSSGAWIWVARRANWPATARCWVANPAPFASRWTPGTSTCGRRPRRRSSRRLCPVTSASRSGWSLKWPPATSKPPPRLSNEPAWKISTPRAARSNPTPVCKG